MKIYPLNVIDLIVILFIHADVSFKNNHLHLSEKQQTSLW